jgi:hypothetical protein
MGNSYSLDTITGLWMPTGIFRWFSIIFEKGYEELDDSEAGTSRDVAFLGHQYIQPAPVKTLARVTEMVFRADTMTPRLSRALANRGDPRF